MQTDIILFSPHYMVTVGPRGEKHKAIELYVREFGEEPEGLEFLTYHQFSGDLEEMGGAEQDDLLSDLLEMVEERPPKETVILLIEV